MSSVTYSCTALDGKNKKGLIKPDSDGYYPIVLGALDMANSSGAVYPLEGARHIFEESSAFMRRVRSGNLRGECGHPRRPSGQSDREFIPRVLEIYEPNVCCHIKEVKICKDSVKDKHGKNVVAILGKVKPAGPKGPALQAALENPNEDVCFSLRSLTNDIITQGSWTKNLKVLVTFDWVNEPGLDVARKWYNPSLESHNLDTSIIRQLAESSMKNAVGMEDDSEHVTVVHVAREFDLFEDKRVVTPRSLEW